MSTFLFVVAVIAGIVAMGYGAWLMFKGFVLGRATFKFMGMEIDGPLGIVIFLAGLGGLFLLPSHHLKGVEAENVQLKGRLQETRTELDAAKKDGADLQSRLEKARSQRDAEGKRADGLSVGLQSLQAEKERAERKLLDSLKAEAAERRRAEQKAQDAWIVADRISLSEDQKAELDKLSQGVLALNKELGILKIRTAYWPIISGRKAVATFEVYRKDFESGVTRPRGAGLFEFAAERYQMKGDYAGKLTEQLSASIAKIICDAAQRAIFNAVPLREAVRTVPELARYEADPQLLMALAELQYVRMRLQMLAADSLVAVRGYADGERGPWEHPLDASRSKMQVHENADPTAKPADYALTFKPELSQVTVGLPASSYTKYGNEDLPNLRGAEAAAVVWTLVKTCQHQASGIPPGRIAVGILEGRVYHERSEEDRKARVHLLVFLKEK
jgi:hypothetical protein